MSHQRSKSTASHQAIHAIHLTGTNPTVEKDHIVIPNYGAIDSRGATLIGIHVSHQDLGDMEWKGTKELAKEQADHFGLQIHYSKRRDKNGYEETLLEYIERRGCGHRVSNDITPVISNAGQVDA